MWIFFYIFFVLTSVVFVPSKVPDQFWVPKESVFFILGSVYVLSSFAAKKKISFKFCNLWVFLASCFVLFVFFLNFYLPIIFNDGTGYAIKIWNLRPTLNFFVGVLIIKTLVESTDSFKRWVVMSKVMAWSGFIIACYSLVQWSGIDPIFNMSKYSFNMRNDVFENKILMIGFLSNKFLTTNYIALLSPMCLLFKDYKYKFFYFVMFVSIFLSDCASSLAVFMFCFMLFLLLSGRIKYFLLSLLVCAGFVLLSVYLHKEFLSSSSRVVLWNKIILSWLDSGKAFMGNGIGSFAASGIFSGKKHAMSAHNEFVQIIFEGGIPLAICLAGYLTGLFRKLWHVFFSNRSVIFIVYLSAFTGYLLLSFVSFPLRIAPLALIGIIYIACLETLILNRRII